MSKFKGFTSVELKRPPRSSFDLSHQKRVSGKMGKLMPCLVTECIPGDSFNGSSEVLLRLAPLLAPIYDDIKLYVHYFFVPNRLLWEDWEEFITLGPATQGGAAKAQPVPPYIDIQEVLEFGTAGLLATSSLADYMGLPVNWPGSTGDYAGKRLDIMAFAAYQFCYNEYYVDRNYDSEEGLEAPLLQLPLASGYYADEDLLNLLTLRSRDYVKDYFTSALPFTQRGAEVLIPMEVVPTYFQQSKVINSLSGGLVTNNDLFLSTQNSPEYPPGSMSAKNDPDVPSDGIGVRIENIESLSNGSSSINDFRTAYALQVWLERNAIGGSRYVEAIQARFGVRPQDSRLQRPEYIGGGRIQVNISEVVNTAWSKDSADASIPAGNLSGHGVTYGNTNQFRYFCTEYGFIIGILSIMAEGSYHQGVPRMFYARRSFSDYADPIFAKLGEQQVDKLELFVNAANLTPDEAGRLPIFGYQSRYADWKYIPNTNHGEFHSTLMFWTLTREFDDSPELGFEFLRFDTTTQDRIFAVEAFDNFWMWIYNKVWVKRCLPYFGTPNTMGF